MSITSDATPVAAYTVDLLKVLVPSEPANWVEWASNLDGRKVGDFWVFSLRDAKDALDTVRQVFGAVTVSKQY